MDNCRRFGQEVETLYRFFGFVLQQQTGLILSRQGELAALRGLVKVLAKVVGLKKLRRCYRFRQVKGGLHWREVQSALDYLAANIQSFTTVTIREKAAAPFKESYGKADLAWLSRFLQAETDFLSRKKVSTTSVRTEHPQAA
jgi:hypothetical protein